MSDSAPDVKYVTVTSPSMVKPPKPCSCGCGGKPRHRVKLVMEEWESDEGVPVFWPTQLSALEWSQFRSSLETYDPERGGWFTSGENERFHFPAFCLRDHQNHRVWEDLKEAREQLGEFPSEDIQKIMDACNSAQVRPRAEGNAGGPSKTTQDAKTSGT